MNIIRTNDKNNVENVKNEMIMVINISFDNREMDTNENHSIEDGRTYSNMDQFYVED